MVQFCMSIGFYLNNYDKVSEWTMIRWSDLWESVRMNNDSVGWSCHVSRWLFVSLSMSMYPGAPGLIRSERSSSGGRIDSNTSGTVAGPGLTYWLVIKGQEPKSIKVHRQLIQKNFQLWIYSQLWQVHNLPNLPNAAMLSRNVNTVIMMM